ncbi:hypothetical protein [Actinomadura nitritigenes]|uniref:hypothetical protein n=1 Tax=Actinomadura nitritigenes TaxID=134602 RepID=UPI003D948B53
MIAVRLPGQAAPRLVEALLIAAGVAPRPTDPDDRRAYLALANDLGEGLDTLPAPTTATDAVMTARRHDGGNVAVAANASDTTNHLTPDGTSEHGSQDGGPDGADPNGASR